MDGGILNRSPENCADNCMAGAGKKEGRSPITLGWKGIDRAPVWSYWGGGPGGGVEM